MRDSLIASALAACVVILLTPFAIYGVDWHHDGTMLKAALDVAAGQVLFRDTVMVYGALTCYLHALALLIYPSLISIRLLAVGAYATSVFFNYLAWRTFLPRSLAALSGGIFFLTIPNVEFGTFMPWSSVYAMMFQSLCLYSLFQIVAGSETSRWGLVLGLSAACVFWCRQTVGLLLIFAVMGIFLALRAAKWKPPGAAEWRALRWVAGGFFLVNVALFAGILLPGAFHAWWYQNYVWPRHWASEGFGGMAWRHHAWESLRPVEAAGLAAWIVAAGLPRFFSHHPTTRSKRLVTGYYLVLLGLVIWQWATFTRLVSMDAGGWALTIVLVVAVQTGFSVFHVFRSQAAPRYLEPYLTATLGALSLASLAQYFPVPDRWHIAWALSPTVGLFVYALWRWTGWRAGTLTIVLSACLFSTATSVARSIRFSMSQPAVTLTAPAFLKGMRVSPQQAQTLAEVSTTVDRALRYAPALPSALLGQNALLLCFTPNRENPTPYVFNLPGLAPAEEEEKRFNYIQAKRPLLYFCNPKRDILAGLLHATRYTSLAYIPELDVEIAAPDEALRPGRPEHP